MTVDSLCILRDGTVDLDANEALAISTTANADGAKVLDIKETGIHGLVAVMILPSTPTTYADTLTVHIQASNEIAGNYITIASFPVLYTYIWKVPVVADTAAAVEADIGLKLTGGVTGDTGVIVHIDNALFTLNGEGYVYAAQDAVGDVFDDDDEALTAATGTLDGTQNGAVAAAATGEMIQRYSAPSTHLVKFSTDKRYIRGSFTPSAGSNFGKGFMYVMSQGFEKKSL